MQFSSPHVRLGLQQPNSEIELGGDIDLLVPGQVERIIIKRVAVMTSDERDIAVASVAKFCTAIADGSSLGRQGRRADKWDEQERKESREGIHRPSVKGESGSVHTGCPWAQIIPTNTVRNGSSPESHRHVLTDGANHGSKGAFKRKGSG